MSVTRAHNIIKQLELTPKEQRQLVELLKGKPKPKRKDKLLEWCKEDFRETIAKEIQKRKSPTEIGPVINV